MTSRCLKLIVSLLLLRLVACQAPVPPVASPPVLQSPVQPIADAYGFRAWDQVERIDFTYHQTSSDRQVQRRWTWEPKSDWVTLHGDARGGSVSYQTIAIGPDAPAEIAQAHAWFVHDRRRLLLPVELVWHNALVSDAGTAPPPSGSGLARRLAVTFVQPDGTRQNGELFVDDASHMVVETLHPIPSPGTGWVATRWEEHARVGPIIVALRRVGADGSVTWFSDVRIKVAGVDQLQMPELLP